MAGYKCVISEKGMEPFVFKDRYLCSSCGNVLRDPVQTACGHFYCSSCVEALLRSSSSRCLRDNEELTKEKVFNDNFMRREVLSLPVQCAKQCDGCDWTGELRQLEDHEAQCLYTKVRCIFPSCGVLVLKGDLSRHLEEECMSRQQQCQYYKLMTTTDQLKPVMEHTKSGESDASSGEEPTAKRRRRDPNAQTYVKSVMVLLDSDVSVSKNNKNVVLMPNTIELAQLKKPVKGRYGKMTFTTQMTQSDVLTALHLKFPILRTKRLGCASAADNRTRLDFHGDKQIWNGALINRHTRGNSALYVYAEGNHESKESQVLLEGPVLAATQRLKQMSQMSSTEPEMLPRGRVDLTTQAHHTTGGILHQARLSVVQKMQSDPVLQTIADPVAQASLKPVSMTTGSQQRVLIAQISKQGSSLQQAPPAAAHNDVPVGAFFPQTTPTKKLSVTERKRKSRPNAHQEIPLLVPVSEGETTDSGIDSLLEIGSNHDTVQSRDIVHEISPGKGSTKGGDKFHILLQEIASFEVDYVACFQNCGTVHLEETVNPFTLTGVTPKSLQGPGPVIVTLSSLDGSWWGGEAVFEYIDDPLTDEEYLCKVVTDEDMRRKLFDRMHKEMSSNKLSDGQTSDSFCKTGPGSSSLNQSSYAWSVKLLQLLVYKAAEIGGREFIQILFSTSAGKVVFNSYRNCATLPEDVARTNGYLALANYLQDVHSRLSKESIGDAGTESIDWLELKHAVDEEQSLTSGTDEAQILKKCQAPGYPESDDDESDYFADDELSPSLSPCHNDVFDSEKEAQSQNSKVIESSYEQEVSEEDNLPVENIDSSELPLHLEGNQLEVILSMEAENAGYKYKQLDSDDVESHGSGDGITEKEHESTCPYCGEVEIWDPLGSEVIFALEEDSTGTTSLHTVTHKCHDVVVTYGSESGLDGDQRELRVMDNDENSGSRAWQKPTEKSVCMLVDHPPQKNSGICTERLLKDLPCKEREPTIRSSVLDLTKLKQIDLADVFEKYFSPSDDHKDFVNRKKSPTENCYISFESFARRAQVEQDLEREVLVVDLPPGNGSKETLAPVEPEQRAHANNNGDPSVQDPEEQLRDLFNHRIVQATINEKDSSLQDPAEHLRDQDDDASVCRRNNDGMPGEAPGGETDDERAYPNDSLLQGRSGDGSHQGQDFANRKKSPMENSYRSFDSLTRKTQVEQDLKGEVLVVDLPPGNGSKETLAPVEPEQRAHGNNSNGDPSVQDPEEQFRDLNDDASVHRRNNDGLPGGAARRRTISLVALLQDSSGYGSHQGQGAASVAVSRPFKWELVPNPASHLKRASEKRKIDSETAQQESSSQQSHPGLAKQRKRKIVVLKQKKQKKSSSTTVTAHSGSRDLKQTEKRVLMYQTLLPAVPKGLLGTTPLLGTTVGSSQQVQHCDKAVSGNIHLQVLSPASQQSSKPTKVMVMTPICLQSDLSLSTATTAQGGPPQHWPIGRVHSVEHETTDPREPVPLRKEQQERTVPNVRCTCEALKSLSHCSKHDQRAVAQASLKPVSTTSGSQQRELIVQTSEQGCPMQQAPSAAAAHKNVPVAAFSPQTAFTKKPSVSERKSDFLPRGYQECQMAADDDCQEMQYWNGTSCVPCSGCPRGFGLKKKCQFKTDTECVPCWPGYDYSNTIGFESCILCDKHSNCLPGSSKNIENCTVFSGPVCDGCEDGNYFDPLLGGCVKCSSPCSILQEEIRSCTTDHDWKCRAKRTVTPPASTDSPTSPAKEIPPTDDDERVDSEPPPLAAKRTPSTSSIPLVQNGGLWGGGIGGFVLLVIAIAVTISKGKSRNRRKRHATDGKDGQQRVPLMPDLDHSIRNLNVQGRRFITQRLNGSYHDSYFYWQMCADKLGLHAECESWKRAENPAEKFLTAYAEKAGSTIRKLVEVLRDPEVDLTQIANEIEGKFSPPQDQVENVEETEL